MSNHRILVPLADGFEEIEALAIIDVLRRAGLDVVVAGLSSSSVRGAHGVTVEADSVLDDVDRSSLTAICLPGGMPGSKNLASDERVLGIVRELAGSDRWVTAICAAPTVLAVAGVVDGVRVTSYPSFRDQLGGAVVVHDERVVESGKIVTSQGPGTAIEFALTLVRHFAGAEVADELSRAMLVQSAVAS